ncbi:hypothetical protein BC937DRAFT_86907 [Endogone sp. FLAS-F59071]|nr:hypothetical protein BC937DRAFT_86907 [Endogone sp. FLAS-F59071]|eukprot:RUS19804.1 hypothetical protein BC937DRAFT_86907 [Endogone sp. FLAS-F59071]
MSSSRLRSASVAPGDAAFSSSCRLVWMKSDTFHNSPTAVRLMFKSSICIPNAPSVLMHSLRQSGDNSARKSVHISCRHGNATRTSPVDFHDDKPVRRRMIHAYALDHLIQRLQSHLLYFCKTPRSEESSHITIRRRHVRIGVDTLVQRDEKAHLHALVCLEVHRQCVAHCSRHDIRDRLAHLRANHWWCERVVGCGDQVIDDQVPGRTGRVRDDEAPHIQGRDKTEFLDCEGFRVRQFLTKRTNTHASWWSTLYAPGFPRFSERRATRLGAESAQRPGERHKRYVVQKLTILKEPFKRRLNDSQVVRIHHRCCGRVS